MKKSWIISTTITISLIFLLMISTSENILEELKIGLDLQGGFEILYEVQDPYEEKNIAEEELVKQTAALISDRIDLLGISEPVITMEDEDRIRIQVPGVKDQEEAREFISIGGNITFRDTDNNFVISSTDFKSVGIEHPSQDLAPVVTIEFGDSIDMRNVTKTYEDQSLALWLDYVDGDAYIKERAKEDSKILFEGHIDETWTKNSGMAISGKFTQKEAELLSKALSTGDLPAPLEEISSQSVSGQLGEQALKNTMIAGIIAMTLIFLFMIWRYRWLGLLSIVCMISYLYLAIGIFVFLEGVLTLTGLAAFILGLGMAIDATIITFERLKEIEDRRLSFEERVMQASNRTFLTIADAHLTTLIAAAGLFVFGVGSVKGFATMLLISIVAGFLTCYALLRLLLYMIGETKLVEWNQERKS
ncbi:protein translocase subunit SecD [Alkalihalobacillus hwajinpoensis]|uniref:protein translocase subunit SecD n=1 Tax=Guptibacillus hwajinpoensis TaxID=208199 RepID=UPI001883F19F|nr:protein translocase subunit SecD [Pseudalkalibacillus hwajinpoensis]MBF0707566.1 protein translocase subunit SecD [Pseudalkalibacillus hwajinpoensis]